MLKYTCAALLLSLCALAVPRAVAGVIHPNVMGTTVNFTNIEEDSPSGDPLPLFGPPSLSGDNSLDFDPTANFSAHTENGGADVTDGKIKMMIRAKPGFDLQAIHILESGLVSLLSLGSDDPVSFVTGLVDLDVVEVDGHPIPQVNLPSFQFNFSPHNGTFQFSVVAVGPTYSAGWTGSLNIDLDAALAAAHVPFVHGATKVNLTLDNRLLAGTGQLGSIAIIDKKDFDIMVDTGGRVPEPSTALLALAGAALGLVALRRHNPTRARVDASNGSTIA